ncbi:hypothetical protein SVI_2065 [Shewanella violacea DSS12]|uniref:Uncharacterized protein n=1 Tax=Shewanella violacea (strain JCM 10179 / CIP 106290 / LMG 19151 / DSS12) TaxID=637905 RepID=D4ZK37_SHEVD|nr:hypothetical protein SVI_2065 [Shewanella violacea DSS12]
MESPFNISFFRDKANKFRPQRLAYTNPQYYHQAYPQVIHKMTTAYWNNWDLQNHVNDTILYLRNLKTLYMVCK